VIEAIEGSGKDELRGWMSETIWSCRHAFRGPFLTYPVLVFSLLYYLATKWQHTTCSYYWPSVREVKSLNYHAIISQVPLNRTLGLKPINHSFFFNFSNPSCLTINLELTQPLTEMHTRNLLGNKGWPAHKADLTTVYVQIFCKIWDPRRPKSYGPPQTGTGIALLFLYATSSNRGV
jgi:hypothetical protein